MEDELERNTMQGVPTFSLLGKATQERSTAQSLPSLIVLALWVPFSVDDKLEEKNPFILLLQKKSHHFDIKAWRWRLFLNHRAYAVTMMDVWKRNDESFFI